MDRVSHQSLLDKVLRTAGSAAAALSVTLLAARASPFGSRRVFVLRSLDILSHGRFALLFYLQGHLLPLFILVIKLLTLSALSRREHLEQKFTEEKLVALEKIRRTLSHTIFQSYFRPSCEVWS